MSPHEAYEELVRRSRERSLLGSCAALLGWDEQTYMPCGGAEHRAAQLALLAGLTHERAIDPRIGELLAIVEGSPLVADPESDAAANVREWRRDYDRATKLPKTLVEELAHATSLGQQVWVEARGAADFGRFQPALETILRLKQQEAACLAGGTPSYDALLDEYEPGMTAETLRPLFDTLRQALVPMIVAISDAPNKPDVSILRRDYPVERQRVFGEMIAAAFGFDFGRGRLDTSAHPFCTDIGPGDCRITTRYNPRDFSDAFYSILHETGHALYEQGLDPAHHGTPLGQAVSLGVHESQSRLWENAVGRSRAFWTYALPLARWVFHNALRDADVDTLYAAVNHVEPSLIRVEADEVTYNLHIIIRFELEQALLSGDLPVGDLPGAWTSKYEQYLNVTPKNDAEGCLQDIHWSAGLFGYFPTYTLGNVYSAQLFDRARADLGDLDALFARGEFAPLLDWLRDKVHRHGRRYTPADLVTRAVGAPPDPGPLLASLSRRLTEVYSVALAR
ncbi:MAG: thermostable carboxypeptidase 1 [Isosphaeraceae bacterium]|jgi:carboxypeptidase Taq|nr:MAG: thermostable carboxypeptidase 1 [Isosphaeraceae bacterium]